MTMSTRGMSRPLRGRKRESGSDFFFDMSSRVESKRKERKGKKKNSPTSHIRSNQDTPPTALELVQRSESSALTQLTVQGDGRETEHSKDDGETLSVVNGRGEDDDGVC